MTRRKKPKNMKKFLVATDLSPRAQKAVTRAAQLTEDHKGTLTVLHIAEAGYGSRTKQMASKIEKDLRREVEGLSFQNDRVTTVRVLSGTPFVEIIRQSREEAADLIVLGAHGEDFIKDLLLGTTAEKIARKGDRSVLVVKRATQGPYRRVLVAVDFSENSRQALEFALRVAPQAEFHVVHIYHGSEGMLRRAGITASGIARYRSQVAKEARQQMEAFLRSIDQHKPIRREVWHGRAHREIPTIARQLHADLVAVGTAGRTGVPYILLGSVAEHVMREASCDVLVVRSRVSHFQLP